jgi:hypothetical protein
VALGGALLVLGVIGAVVVGAAMLKRGITGGNEDGNGTASRDLVKPEYNFAFAMPPAPWERDADTQTALGVTAFALRRAEAPEAWVALSVKDFKGHNPMAHELRERMTEHLNGAFLHVPEDLTLEPAKWAGKDAYRCQFRGVRKDSEAVCVGECHALGYKGVGYWFYAWAAERDYDAVSAELAGMRDRFRTLAEREGWNPPTGTRVTFPRKGTHKARYQLHTYEKYWTESPGLEPTDVRKEGDLLLTGTLPIGKSDFRPKAEVVVLVFDDGTADPGQVAAREVRKWYTRDPDVFGKFTVTELTGDPEGEPSPGEEPGGIPATRFAVTVDDPNASRSVEKLVVFSAIRIGDKVVVAEANCPLNQRKVWERKLVQFVGSLRPL